MKKGGGPSFVWVFLGLGFWDGFGGVTGLLGLEPVLMFLGLGVAGHA